MSSLHTVAHCYMTQGGACGCHECALCLAGWLLGTPLLHGDRAIGMEEGPGLMF